MAARYLMFRQRHQAGDARFRGQQIVEVVVQLAGGHVVADVEHLPLWIEHETEVHFAEIGFGQLVNLLQSGQQVLRQDLGSRQLLVKGSTPGASLVELRYAG